MARHVDEIGNEPWPEHDGGGKQQEDHLIPTGLGDKPSLRKGGKAEAAHTGHGKDKGCHPEAVYAPE